MPKSHHSNKENKKEPLLTPKEKKKAKLVKKHLHDVQPLITRVTH